jgi:hypothetical protein
MNQLVAVKRRLHHLHCLLLAGGPERVAAVGAWVNERAQRFFPAAPLFAVADLSGVVVNADGSGMQLTFSQGDKVGPGAFFSVTVEVPRQGEPTLRSVIPCGFKHPPTLKRRTKAGPQPAVAAPGR